jgi:hypothetical protein
VLALSPVALSATVPICRTHGGKHVSMSDKICAVHESPCGTGAKRTFVKARCLLSPNRRHRACISYDEENATEKAISKCPGQCRGFEDFDFSVVDWETSTNGCSPSFEDSCVLNGREISSLLE